MTIVQRSSFNVQRSSNHHHHNRDDGYYLDETAEGLLGEQLYYADAKPCTYADDGEHQQVEREGVPRDIVPCKYLERNLQQVNDKEEPCVDAYILHLVFAHGQQIDGEHRTSSVAYHRGETAKQSEYG